MLTKQITSVLWLFAAATSLVAGTISVDPAAPTETVGQSFTLNVNISGESDLYGYQFDLGFNPAVLEATAVSEGTFLSTGGPTIFVPGAIDNVGGTIAANADILDGAVSGVSGSGNLLSVTFLAIGAGSSDVQVFNLFALNSFGLGLTETTSGSTVTVTAPATAPEPGSWLLLGSGIAAALAASKASARRT
jgi:general secretion pathway protein D